MHIHTFFVRLLNLNRSTCGENIQYNFLIGGKGLNEVHFGVKMCSMCGMDYGRTNCEFCSKTKCLVARRSLAGPIFCVASVTVGAQTLK